MFQKPERKVGPFHRTGACQTCSVHCSGVPYVSARSCGPCAAEERSPIPVRTYRATKQKRGEASFLSLNQIQKDDLPIQARDTHTKNETFSHFSRHLYINTIIMPRQARDKHRESTQKRMAFSYRASLRIAGRRHCRPRNSRLVQLA